jgi:hypothetical protein
MSGYQDEQCTTLAPSAKLYNKVARELTPFLLYTATSLGRENPGLLQACASHWAN